MSDQVERNYRGAIDRLGAGFNKGVILQAVTNRSLEILSASMDEVESSLSSVVAAFEEIRATSASTAQNAERIDGMMASILEKNAKTDASVALRAAEVEAAAAGARKVGELFAELQQRTKAISEITLSIRDVSERTNILAINASIEAARAGAVGRGFRIIANEVRSLAAQTGDFAKEIDKTTEDFRSSVGAISAELKGFLELLERFRASFAEVLANFKANAEDVGEAGKFLSEISGALKEENEALAEGLDSLEEISGSAKDTHAVFEALTKSHVYVGRLLEKLS